MRRGIRRGGRRRRDTLLLLFRERETQQGVGDDIVLARDIMKDRVILLEEQPPTEDPLRVESSVGKIFMVRMDVQFGAAEKHGAELLKGFDNGE